MYLTTFIIDVKKQIPSSRELKRMLLFRKLCLPNSTNTVYSFDMLYATYALSIYDNYTLSLRKQISL